MYLFKHRCIVKTQNLTFLELKKCFKNILKNTVFKLSSLLFMLNNLLKTVKKSLKNVFFMGKTTNFDLKTLFAYII